MNATDALDWERLPTDSELDETDVNLRAYLSRIPDEKLRQYDPSWSDEEVMAWDGNFRNDNCVMLVCCTRDVDVAEFRKVLEDHRAARFGTK